MNDVSATLAAIWRLIVAAFRGDSSDEYARKRRQRAAERARRVATETELEAERRLRADIKRDGGE